MDSDLSWTRVSSLPFFNITQFRKLIEENPVYSFGRNRNYFENEEDGNDDYDYDKSENIEDESVTSSFSSLFNRNNSKKDNLEADVENSSSGLSGDSLAFTLVYASVFSVTLLYVGLKLAKRWRDKQRSRVSVSSSPSSSSSIPIPLPPCGHPQCSRSLHQQQQPNNTGSTGYLPYTGLGAAWIPEIMTLQGFAVQHPQVHSTATCRGRCNTCRNLSQPPPSYNKLFLEEQPPAYDDSVVIKDSEERVEIENCDECRSLTVSVENGCLETCENTEEVCFLNEIVVQNSEENDEFGNVDGISNNEGSNQNNFTGC